MVALICIIFFSPVNADGYATRGRSDEGMHSFVITGYIGNSASSVIFISQIDNGSQARSWEVIMVIITQDPNVEYLVSIHDNHMELDHSIPSGEVLTKDERESRGNSNFGPFLVYANGDPTYGDLIWTIRVTDLQGKELYIHFIMRWGFGSDPPISIGGEEQGSSGSSGSGTLQNVGKYTLGNLAWFVAVLLFNIRRTKSKVDKQMFEVAEG